MIGILGGMGTQAGLDFCNKLTVINRGKTDQKYPLFILYNKSNIPRRPENIKKYYNVLNSLIKGCHLLQKNKCKFIVMPCNTAHYWYDDLLKKIKIPILSMPKEVYLHTKKSCKKNSKIGILIWWESISTNTPPGGSQADRETLLDIETAEYTAAEFQVVVEVWTIEDTKRKKFKKIISLV